MEGGVGAFTRELARGLAPAGYPIHIISHRLSRPERVSLSQLSEPVNLGFAWLHPRARHWRWGDISLIADLVLRHNLPVVNLQYQPAAYNMNNPAINFLPWRLRGLAATVVTFHDLRLPYLFPKAGRIREWVVRFMAAQATGVIATNQADYAQLTQWLPPTKVRLIPIGSNIVARVPAGAEIAAVRQQLGLTDDHFLLGYFGFLNESKGADTLLAALAGLEERVHLVFIGGRTGASDPLNNRRFGQALEGSIEQLGLSGRVHWTTFMADEQVSAYLHAADLMVMPYRDGVSLRRGTLMAALAHARPVISTHPAGPVPELIHGKNIWLVPAGQPALLTQAIQSLQQQPVLRQQLAGAAGRVAAHFSWDSIASQTAQFLAQQLGRLHLHQ